MNTTTSCLIEKNAFFAEGLKSTLSGSAFRVAETRAGIPAPEEARPDEKIDLVIAAMEEDCEPRSFIDSVREAYPACRLVILSEKVKCESAMECFSAGIDGLCSKNMTPSALINALSMVMAGEKFFPAHILDALAERKPASDGKPGNAILSDCEAEILKHLARGESNKQIAIGRNIAEATVKVHVKSIFRKLHFSNRTQAALWATEHMRQDGGSVVQVVNI